MKRIFSALVVLSVVAPACQFNAIERDIEHREVGLFVPTSIRAVEPAADRVTVLHPTGRTTVMDKVVLRRDGTRFRLEPLDKTVAPIEIELANVQAFEIERWTRGEQARLLVKDQTLDSDVDDTFVNVFGGVLIGAGLVTALFLSIEAMGEN